MQFWIKKNECTGCGVCSNICPNRALSMIEDELGFRYPQIDQELCINCGLCKKTCPIISKYCDNKFKEPQVYASWSKNANNRFMSTSGGIFFEIAKNVILEHGYVVGAAYDKDNMVEHIVVDNIIDLEKLRQSKYLQSNTKQIYSETKKILEKNGRVAFAGAPCQIAGLYSFLKKKYDNLITIEFICRGVNSPKAYKSWLNEIEKKENKKIKRVWFKYKEYGWKNSPKCTRIDFCDGSFKIYSGSDNKFMSGYLGPNLYIRSACGVCHFKHLHCQADITLADFWGVENKLDDDKGTSMVLINSEVGEKYFKKAADSLFYNKKSLKDIFKGNECFFSSVKINKKSIAFLREVNGNNFSELVDKYSKISILRKISNMFKRVVRKIITFLRGD